MIQGTNKVKSFNFNTSRPLNRNKYKDLLRVTLASNGHKGSFNRNSWSNLNLKMRPSGPLFRLLYNLYR